MYTLAYVILATGTLILHPDNNKVYHTETECIAVAREIAGLPPEKKIGVNSITSNGITFSLNDNFATNIPSLQLMYNTNIEIKNRSSKNYYKCDTIEELK